MAAKATPTGMNDSSPASIARTRADRGAPLDHPDVLQADVRWREGRELLTPEDLTFETLEGATHLVKKIETLRQQLEDVEDLRKCVLRLKEELQLIGSSERIADRKRQLAQEVAEWFRVWLQNPQIFVDWLDLRRNTAEFQERFSE